MNAADADTVVVFDFDLTLTHWDTADRFFRWLLQRDRWRVALVLLGLPLVGPLFALRATRKWPIRYAVWCATLGRTPKQEIDRGRCERVAELLRRPGGTRERLAEHCGFSGGDELCRFIKRVTGSTPGEIRRGA